MRKQLRIALTVLALTPLAARADGEADVKAVFVEFQAALKSRDADKIWPLLDATTQKAVEKTATALFAEHDGGTAATKAQFEKMYGLTAEEIGQLKTTPKLYCKSKRFLDKWREVPGSTLDKAIVDGDKATVKYTEEDNDKEEVKLSKQEGKWKIVLPKIP